MASEPPAGDRSVSFVWRKKSFLCVLVAIRKRFVFISCLTKIGKQTNSASVHGGQRLQSRKSRAEIRSKDPKMKKKSRHECEMMSLRLHIIGLLHNVGLSIGPIVSCHYRLNYQAFSCWKAFAGQYEHLYLTFFLSYIFLIGSLTSNSLDLLVRLLSFSNYSDTVQLPSSLLSGPVNRCRSKLPAVIRQISDRSPGLPEIGYGPSIAIAAYQTFANRKLSLVCAILLLLSSNAVLDLHPNCRPVRRRCTLFPNPAISDKSGRLDHLQCRATIQTGLWFQIVMVDPTSSSMLI